VAHALYIDRFGNVQLDISHDDLADSGLKLGHRARLAVPSGTFEAQYALTFADVQPGHVLLYEDADRRLAVAVSHGNASERVGLALDDELRITPL
jgi:hypothetical protein